MLPATTVPLEDGLRVTSLAGRGELEPLDGGDPGRFDSRHAHCEVLVVGAGRVGPPGRGRRPMLRTPRTGSCSSTPDPAATGDGVRAGTTALGIYDHGYVTGARATTDPDHGGSALAHPGQAHRARDRRHRAAHRLRRRRPARDHARAVPSRPTSSATACAPASAPSIFTNNGTTEAVAASARGCRHGGRGDRRRARRRPGRRHDRGRRRTASCGPRRPGRGSGRRPSTPTSCSCPAAGTRTWRSGATPAARSASTSRSPRSSPIGPARTAAIEAVGAAAGDIDGLGEIAPTWVVPPPGPATEDALGDPLRRHRSRRHRRATCGGRSARASNRSSTSSATRRSAPASSRGAAAGVVASAIAASMLGPGGRCGRRADVPAADRAGHVRPAGRPRPGHAARRPGPHDADPAVARRQRRRVRGRRPVEAPALLPARRRDRWTRRSCASAPPLGRGSR